MQEMHRKTVEAESDFDKQKALLEQRISFLEASLEDKKSKEREYMTSWTNQKSERNNESRNVCQRYESQL